MQTGETVTLDGSYSTDPDDAILSYLWRQKAGNPVTLDEPAAVKTSFIAPETGVDGNILTFQLTVTDPSGLQSTGDSQVVVLPVDQAMTPKNLWVSNIQSQIQKTSKRKYVAIAHVTVIDEDFNLVEGATVTGNWSLGWRTLSTSSGQTDSNGTAQMESRLAWARSGRILTFTVTGVVKEGYSYDPSSNIKTKDSVTVP